LEYANEVWNTVAGVSGVLYDITNNLSANDPGNPLLAINPTTNQWYSVWRYPAWRMATISQIFSGIFGSNQMMTRVRPLLETQQGNGQNTLQQGITWLDAYAQTLSPSTTVASLLYGGGGSAYYGVTNSSNASPDSIFASGNYPDSTFVQNWGVDSMWLYNYGIKHVAYEGGAGISTAFTDAQNLAINADPRMEQMTDAYQTAWSQQGGDLLIYYALVGPTTWEFTSDITNISTPKFAALADIQAAPRAAVTLGATLPATSANPLTATAMASESIRTASGYNTTIGSQSCVAGFGPGTYIAYPAHSASAYNGALVLSGTSSAASEIGIWINGVQQGTATLAAQPKSALESSNSVAVTIPAGLSMIRLQVVSGSLTFCSLTAQ
jgi:hypothetical protein